MEIKVGGKATKKVTPDVARINLSFTAREKNYERAMEKGVQSVLDFSNSLVKHTQLGKESMKTNSFNVREIRKSDSRKVDYFEFHQSVDLRFDFDAKVMAKIVDFISDIENPPKYNVWFEVSTEEKIKDEILALACADAEKRATILAKAMGFKRVKCTKISLGGYYGDDDIMMCEEASVRGLSIDRSGRVEEAVEQTFTPQDREITQNVNCVFTAE